MALKCKLLTDEFQLCGHQYFCTITKKYEHTDQARKCPLEKRLKSIQKEK